MKVRFSGLFIVTFNNGNNLEPAEGIAYTTRIEAQDQVDRLYREMKNDPENANVDIDLADFEVYSLGDWIEEINNIVNP